MAEIEKDLPDPLETPLGGSSTDPDDLVAQLAGDAIDRLLEDAERGIVPPRPKPEDDPLNEIDPLPSTPPTQSNLDEATPDEVSPTPPHEPTGEAPTAEVKIAEPPVVPSKPEPEPEPDPDPGPPTSGDSPADAEPTAVDESPEDVPPAMQAELDSLFSSLGNEPAEDPADAPGALRSDAREAAEEAETADVAQVAAPDPEARKTMPPPMDVPPDIANDDGHGGATQHQSADDDPADLDSDASLQADVKQLLNDATDKSPGGPPAFIVAPLRLINAPFASLSDSTRDILGQIALVTLVNAVAIMVYVLFFR